MTAHIPTEAVWAAWDRLHEGRDETYFDAMRAALEAALPHLRPEPSEDEASRLAERLRQIAESQRMDFDSPSVAATLDEAADALTRRPVPSREQTAQVVSDFLAPILGQSPGGPSQMDYDLADAVLALFKGGER